MLLLMMVNTKVHNQDVEALAVAAAVDLVAVPVEDPADTRSQLALLVQKAQIIV